AAAGNVIGQGVQNGGLKDINIGSAALSGLAGGLTSGVGAAAGGGIKTAAETAAAQGGDVMAKMFNPNTMVDTAMNMGSQYMTNPIAGAAAIMGNTPAVFKEKDTASSKQKQLQDDWNSAIGRAINHEADYNFNRYAGVTNGRAPTPDDVRTYMTSAGVGPYPGAVRRGYAEGGAVTPVGLGLVATVDDMQKQQQAGMQNERAMSQTQEMFDIAVMLVTGKLNQQESQKAYAMLQKALGPEGAQQYLQQVQEAVSGGEDPKLVDGQPSARDNVMAQDAQTGEPIKLASGEGILPSPMVQAAGGGLRGIKNIVKAASQGLPQIRDHAMRFDQMAAG
ncbi:MAG: hypothetical protein B7Z37_23470, partial [Verrucomicrobia bacterium 12-59-8]